MLRLCPVQVTAVNGIELDTYRSGRWNLVRGSDVLSYMTVTDFLDLPSREARRDLLHVASKQTDGTHSLDLGEAQVLADALQSRLSLGVWWWGGLASPSTLGLCAAALLWWCALT